METKINRPSFDKTVGVLVKAYLNDTLEHQNCYACAVGNIVAASLGIQFVRVKGAWHELQWSHNDAHWYTYLSQGKRYDEFQIQIDATGYSKDEIIRIENAFESVQLTADMMFNGLMAVVDVLADIHGVDLTLKDEAKKLFLKTI